MSGKDQQFLFSRIFGSRAGNNLSKDKQTRNLVAQRTEEETFVKDADFMTDQPSGTIYDRDKIYGVSKHIKAHDIGTWVTIIGTIPGHTDEVVQYFSKYGTILRVEDTSGNWMYIEYPSTDIAKSVVDKCSGAPQLISNRMAVACVAGRVRSEFVTQKPKPPDKVEFVPNTKGVVIPEEKRGIVGTIFDSIFG
ncbi:Nucleoporin nup35 [Tritrichomonas musculus]|uniref:Nucleoporin nup35 n=1 Tax=Tritrichomonas musculus TaxID=1915356 RepID=A0ABR2IJM0_9EUKA